MTTPSCQLIGIPILMAEDKHEIPRGRYGVLPAKHLSIHGSGAQAGMTKEIGCGVFGWLLIVTWAWAMSPGDNRAAPASLCPASGGLCSRVSMRLFHSRPAFVGRTVRIPAEHSFPARWRFAGIQRAVGSTGFACVVPLPVGLSCFVCERPVANPP